jgi:hypothetical protein
MSKKREFSAKDLDKIILSGKSIRAAEFEDEVGETDAEGILEELLEQVLLDTDIISVDRISTFEEAGVMTKNKGLVFEVTELEDINTGKVVEGPFEFQITITSR